MSPVNLTRAEVAPGIFERLRRSFVEVGLQIPTSTGADPCWTEGPVEMLFSLPDVFTQTLFASVCRKHGVEPYEFKRKVRHEMIVMAPKETIERIAADFTSLQREMDDAVWMILVDLIENGLKSDCKAIKARSHTRLG